MAGTFEGPSGADKHSQVTRSLLAGNINSTTTVTLTAGATTTTLTDPNLTPSKIVLFDPVTANAQQELTGGLMYVLTADRGVGSWTITHAAGASTDRTFAVLIMGG